MDITPGERLIGIMLADLMRHLKIQGDLDPDFVAKALVGGDEWMLEQRYGGMFDPKPKADEHVKETYDILMMFQSIRYATNQLAPADQEEIKALPWYAFSGFDGNHDPHFHICNSIINDLGHYTAFNPIDSHSQINLPHYRQMLPQWREMTDGHANALTLDQLRVICA